MAGITYNAPDYQTVSGMEGYTAPTTGANYFFDLVQNATTNNALEAQHVHSLFNGNIRSLTGAINPVPNFSIRGFVRMRGFEYDQANRLKAAATFTGYDIDNNKIDVDNFAMSTKYFEEFSYDGNGNILTLTRNDQDGSTMDELAYKYYDGSNRLEHVENTSGSSNTNKVNAQATNNYEYDHIGNMVKDVSSDIAHIDWNVQGKIWKITHTTGSTHPDLEFKYDPMGHRLCKIVKHGPHQEDGWDYTYYVRDAQGQELATYTKAIATDPAHTDKYKATYQLQQNDLYGSKRLGVLQRSQLLTRATNTIGGHNSDGTITETTAPSATPVTATEGSYAHHAGSKYFELTNHLGNVLATVKDIKIPHDDNTDGQTDYYTASIAGANDYYSFGSIMPNANNKTNDDYKYGAGGQERDKEINNNDDIYSADYWEYDSRLGKRWNVDPIVKEDESSYTCFNDNPLLKSDKNGDDAITAGAVAIATQEVAGALAATGIGAPAVPFVEAIGGVWSLIELFENAPIPKAVVNTVPTKPKIEVNPAEKTKTPVETNSATKNRVTLRKDTKEIIKENQPKNEKGQLIDPNDKKPIGKDKTDIGHKPGEEWRYRKEMHNEKGSNRKEVIEEENDPNLYQIERRSNNRSHKYEAPKK